jgi:hypothetical protein
MNDAAADQFRLLAQFHILPVIIAFLILGILSMATACVCFTFHMLSEIVRAYYDFRRKCSMYRDG